MCSSRRGGSNAYATWPISDISWPLVTLTWGLIFKLTFWGHIIYNIHHSKRLERSTMVRECMYIPTCDPDPGVPWFEPPRRSLGGGGGAFKTQRPSRARVNILWDKVLFKKTCLLWHQIAKPDDILKKQMSFWNFTIRPDNKVLGRYPAYPVSGQLWKSTIQCTHKGR